MTLSLDYLDMFGAFWGHFLASYLYIYIYIFFFEIALTHVDAIADTHLLLEWHWHSPWNEVRRTYLGGRSICTFVVQTSR